MSNSIPNEIKLKKTSTYRARKIFEKWPLLVWLGILGLVLFLYSQRGVKVRINGMVTAHTEEISAPEDGVILKVLVKEGEKVSKGQDLIALDPSLIQKEIDDYKANLPFLRADMERKFKSTRFGINADIQRAKAQKASAESRLETAKRNADLIKNNVEKQLSLQSELDAALSKIDVIQTELTTHAKSIEALNADLKEADQLLLKVDGVNLPQELLVLKERLKNKTLVAPGEGTIFKLNKLGGVTKLGAPILTINLTSPNNVPAKTIRGLIPQDQNPEELSEDQVVWISQRKRKPIAYKAKIIAVSPSIEALPNYGTPIDGQYIRGRVFVCELPDDFEDLLPGTGVHVHIKEPGSFNLWNFGKTPVKAASN